MILKFIILLVVMIGLTFYFLPTIVAIARRHVNAMPIFLTNLYLGWTFLGWALAAVWSFTAHVYSTDSVSAVTYQPATPDKPAQPISVAKTAAIVVAALVAAVILVFMLAPSPTGQKNTEAPVVKTGVPVPADSLFGDGAAQ